jgi:ABC-type multidrug transport system permease subunit
MRRKIAAVAQKEFRHMLHDRFTLALTFGLPIAQLIFYGYALETRIRRVPTAVLNYDTHAAGRLLEQRIARSSLFAIDSGRHSEADVESALRAGTIRVAIEIPPDYTSNLIYSRKTNIRVWVDGADVATSSYLLSALDTLGFEETAQHTRINSEVGIQSTVMFNATGRTSAFLIPGLIAILAQTITTLLAALSITTEREKGTLAQMLTTPIGPTAIIAGKASAVACIGLAECSVLVLLMRYLFSIPIQGSLMLLLSILPLLVLAPIGMGLLIAAAARNQLQALQLANLVLLPSVMLSGFVFPIEFLKFPLNRVSDLLPSTYLVSLTRNIILRGASLPEIAPDLAIASAFGLTLATVGFVALRTSLSLRGS